MPYDLWIGEAVRLTFLAFLVERALALLFESRLWAKVDGKGFSPLVSLAVSVWICWHWDIDAVGRIADGGDVTMMGRLLTAAILAGGMKGPLELWKKVLTSKQGGLPT